MATWQIYKNAKGGKTLLIEQPTTKNFPINGTVTMERDLFRLIRRFPLFKDVRSPITAQHHSFERSTGDNTILKIFGTTLAMTSSGMTR